MSRIKQATDLDNRLREVAKNTPGCVGLSVPLLPALVIEGREVGEKTKRPQDLDEGDDDYCPPPLKRHAIPRQSPSPMLGPAEAALVSPSNDRTEGEENRVPGTRSCRG